MRGCDAGDGGDASCRHSPQPWPPGPALATERLAPPSRRTVSLGLRIARAQ
ncbi:hypothetical protein X888_1700 [Burkholderia pseudomallei MSHR4377]|nr:hypothetical protein X888_1700 [Burkholderia pseudomallei MSHR4377]